MKRLRSRNPDSWFYCPTVSAGLSLTLDSTESQHLVRVMRVAEGSEVFLTSGQGRVYSSVLEKADARGAVLQVKELHRSDDRPQVVLAMGMLKGKAPEEVVEICAQYNLAEIVWLKTAHSQVPAKAEFGKLLQRMEQKSQVALKQARKTWLTQISGPVDFAEWVENQSGQLVLLDEKGESSFPAFAGNTTLLIGPEGGFSDEEKQMLMNRNAALFSLGPTRIRARHAGAFALGALSAASVGPKF